jgi:hypothetical protein
VFNNYILENENPEPIVPKGLKNSWIFLYDLSG